MHSAVCIKLIRRLATARYSPYRSNVHMCERPKHRTSTLHLPPTRSASRPWATDKPWRNGWEVHVRDARDLDLCKHFKLRLRSRRPRSFSTTTTPVSKELPTPAISTPNDHPIPIFFRPAGPIRHHASGYAPRWGLRPGAVQGGFFPPFPLSRSRWVVVSVPGDGRKARRFQLPLHDKRGALGGSQRRDELGIDATMRGPRVEEEREGP